MFGWVTWPAAPSVFAGLTVTTVLYPMHMGHKTMSGPEVKTKRDRWTLNMCINIQSKHDRDDRGA